MDADAKALGLVLNEMNDIVVAARRIDQKCKDNQAHKNREYDHDADPFGDSHDAVAYAMTGLARFVGAGGTMKDDHGEIS
jgi:hypothetical protein